MPTVAQPQSTPGPWSVSLRTLLYAAVGAVIYGFMNYITADIGIPGTEISVRPHFGILPFFGFAFGPIVGFITGFVGNMLGDTLGGAAPLDFWHWGVANGLVGLVAGLFPYFMASRMDSTGSRAAVSAIAAVVAVAVGFLFIFIELIIQSELGFEYILQVEYLQAVVTNSIAAAIVTPILVLAWDPIADQINS
jgi:energy-coupling factor transport system substrate-specific component